MEDSYRTKGLRKRLVEELMEMGINNETVLNAVGDVPRHFFLDTAFLKFAYTNKAFPIGAGQTISHPYTVAVQSTLLEVERGDKVLEVGTGSGYQTAILCAMGIKVYSVERQRSLFLKTKKLLSKLKYDAYLTYGDGYKGISGYGPYKGIIVTCGAPEVPKSLLNQLEINGKMVIPIDKEEGVQEMTRITKIADNQYKEERFGKFRFVPMLPNRAMG
ncbi:protein-L-isoaspartate(D-aspartate) O-methyltransferase [Luteibaculum oceani]|uniref:Protein-L-isoaspartate O-methyltransferase n=1 Tax=Luteibaculum oceani TaxID=1294296 RepID=A0A5C6VAY4_9FLAO|nr:protein-L-isoaspartate(D-aspartate) O-methyltransferase [Luteibaculum oceani]TXC82050.1 protein-L-isoaspartate(D-aspartate) O-methyltransferase [Luteibaculum oceani]